MSTKKNVGIVKISRFEKKTWFDQQKKKRSEEVEKEVTFPTGTAVDGC